MAAMKQFEALIDEVAAESSLQALIIKSAKEDIFIAGADISEIQNIDTAKDAYDLVRVGQGIFDKLAALKIPTIAAINGACLGGGLELALACDYRVASLHPKCKVGLPEVQLGIIPGFGGTQRLPRLIGLSKAIPLIASSKQLDAKKAYKAKLVDAYFQPEFFVQDTLKFVNQIIAKKAIYKKTKLRRKKGLLVTISEHFFLTRALINRIAKSSILSKTKGQYPAATYALKAMVGGYGKSLKSGLKLEAKLFSKCIETPVFKELVHLFFANEALKKTGYEKVSKKDINQAAVIGAGLMGSGIAWAFTYRQIPVILKEVKQEFLSKGLTAIQGILNGLKKRRRLTSRDVTQAMLRVSPTIDNAVLKKSDIVVEAIVEDMHIKQGVYADLEKTVSKDCIIASNTSSLSVDDLSTSLEYPERFIGMHFFSPVNRMPLVEVIPSVRTNKETIATVVDLAKKMKKVPIVVKNCPGFLVNRIFLPYVNEAMNLVLDGAAVEDIDQAFLKFGMPIGPLALADEVGLDVGLKVLAVLEEAFPDRVQVAQCFKDIAKDGKVLGKKSGAGFYKYSKKGPKVVNHELIKYLKPHINKKAIRKGDIINRPILAMLNEAARCLEEGIVADASTLDMAMIMGTGFPPFRGGLLRHADALGIEFVYDSLTRYEKELSNRFKVAPMLEQTYKSRQTIYK